MQFQKLYQQQFPLLSQKQYNKIDYLFEDVDNSNTPFEYLNQYSDEHKEFDIQFRNKKMLAIGSERGYELIKMLTKHKVKDIKQKYADIERTLQSVIFEANHSDVIYSQLYQKEWIISRLVISLIDRHFFGNTLRTWEWDRRIQIIWASQEQGVSASTMRYGNHCIIKVNLYSFVSWIENLKVKDGKSIGNNSCASIFDCIVKTVAHEIVHAILQIGSPCIIDTETNEILMRSKDQVEHYKLKNKYKDSAYIDNYPYFVFGQTHEGPGSQQGKGAPGGHYNTFMTILINIFGQQIPQHNLYTVNYQTKKLKL